MGDLQHKRVARILIPRASLMLLSSSGFSKGNFSFVHCTYLDSSLATCQATRLGSALDFLLVSPARQHFIRIPGQLVAHLRAGVHVHLRHGCWVSGHVLSPRRHWRWHW